MIPLIKPLMPHADSIASWLSGCYLSGTWSNFGEVHKHCLDELKEITGKKNPVLVSSGAAGLDLLTRSIDRTKTVLVPDFTHAGTILPFLNAGMDVWLVECDPRSWAMDLGTLEYILRTNDGTNDIGTIVVVNPFGRGIDRDAYADMARKYRVDLIFDYCGAWGDFEYDDEFATVYSFHATKSLPIGEGGMILLPNQSWADRLKCLSNFGTHPDRMIYDHGGTNFKLSELSSAVLAAQLEHHQLKRIDKRISHRRNLQRIYSTALLSDDGDLTSMNLSLCVAPLPEGIDIREFEKTAYAHNFIAAQYYIPLSSMPGFERLPFVGNKCSLFSRCVGLPSDCTIDTALAIAHDIDSIVKRLSE